MCLCVCACARVRVPPAEPLWDELQVIVGGHEFCEADQLSHSGRNPIKVQLVRVYIQLLQLGQLADSRLNGEVKK